MHKEVFNVYEIETSAGPELVASRDVADPIPPLGVIRELGHVHGVSTEADAVRVARQVDEMTKRFGHKPGQYLINTIV